MNTDKRVNKAIKLQELGRVEDAEILFRKILKSNPSDFVSLYSLGVMAFTRNDFGAALDLFERAKKVQPGFAPLWYNTGLTLSRLSRYDDALANLDQALTIDPNYEEARNHRTAVSDTMKMNAGHYPSDPATVSYTERLGKAFELQALQKLDEAEAIFLALLDVNPNDIPSLYSLGVIAQTRSKPEVALNYFERGLEAKPDYAALWYNCGVVRQSLKQHEKAIECYDKAISLNPEYKEALNNKGTVLVEMKRHKDALLNYEELLKIDPLDDKALNNRGLILTDFKMYDLAIQTFERVLQVAPEYDYALGQLAFTKMHACDWGGLDEIHRKIIEGVRAGKRVCKTQALLAITGDPSDHLKCARIFAQQHCPPQTPKWQGEIYTHAKIRIAYISPDFREHPVGHLTAGIFENHDKSRFETIAISLGIDDGSILRKRMVAAFDQFVDVRQMSTRDVVDMMHKMEIDIVVDLAGYTADSRTDILAHRPAPIQVNFLGYSSTMGSDYIDYIIADRHIIPEELRGSYSEKVAYMPDIYMPTDSTVNIADTTPPREEYGLPAEGFVFCSFNHDYKISPAIFDIWMRLLKQVPGSVLWLMKLNESAERNLYKEAATRGIEADRIIFATRVPRIEDHLARYRMADLFLDTTPYNAHTTTSDVLRAGLPVLTCRGKSFAGRVAAGLLTVVGLSDLITDTLEEYESLAMQLAQNSEMLQNIKKQLSRNLESTPLYDTVRFCRNLERAYTIMWERYQSNKNPESFFVEALGLESQVQDVPKTISHRKRATKSDITLLTIDTDPMSQKLTKFALQKTMECLDIGKIISFGVAPFDLGETFVRINRFNSIGEYSEFLLKCMWPFLPEEGHSLIVHWDGFATNRSLWSDEYLQYDYIGAPWAWVPDSNCVGNGGFCLRSNALIRACSDTSVRRHPEVLFGHAEDIVICRLYREYFEKKGFTFAPKDVASRFSFETGERAGETLGFHSPENMPYYLSENELLTLSNDLFEKMSDGPAVSKLYATSQKMKYIDFSRMLSEHFPNIAA